MINRFEEIKTHYEWVTPNIFKAAERSPNRWTEPYCGIDWMSMFTPIESQTWQAIRCFGQAPFYPQYPVSKYFLDFGNPVVKVGIECDGQEFHQDKERDRNRDLALLEHGWHIYRIPGSDCMKTVSDEYYNIGEFYEEEDQWRILKDFYENTIEGLLKALGIYYFGYGIYYRNPNELELVRKCLGTRISLKDKIFHVNV